MHTFSFGEPKWKEGLVKIPESDIKLLAKARNDAQGIEETNVFQMAVFEVSPQFAMDFEEGDKCIDRGSTLRCINQAAVKGLGWRFHMVRTEFCTRVTKGHMEIEELYDEIRQQTIVGALSRSIRGT